MQRRVGEVLWWESEIAIFPQKCDSGFDEKWKTEEKNVKMVWKKKAMSVPGSVPLS